MPLTDLKVRALKIRLKPYKVSDEKGLYLFIHPNGSKYWRYKYHFANKEKLLALGIYPDVSLADARDRRDEARKQLANQIDPGVLKQVNKRAAKLVADNTFEAIAREWYAKRISTWTSKHGDRIIRRLEVNVFPWIGQRPISDINAPELLAILRRIENRGAIDTAHRTHQNCSQIFRYAIAAGQAQRDPSTDLKGALIPVKVTHYPAITDPKQITGLLRAIESYKGHFVTKCALRLAPLVFLRPGELRQAEWSEFDLDKSEWNIAAKRMKMRQAHLVPLSKQVLNILKELRPLTGNGQYVFPGVRTNTRPMSDNTINGALRRLGYESGELTAHGFRATARTILDEVLGFRPDVIEHQLAHAVKDPLGRAYNRTSHLELRREMMQKWADYLDVLSKET